jgi:hypothetical protein
MLHRRSELKDAESILFPSRGISLHRPVALVTSLRVSLSLRPSRDDGPACVADPNGSYSVEPPVAPPVGSVAAACGGLKPPPKLGMAITACLA